MLATNEVQKITIESLGTDIEGIEKARAALEERRRRCWHSIDPDNQFCRYCGITLKELAIGKFSHGNRTLDNAKAAERVYWKMKLKGDM